ncbi:DUF2283 domain-containing protein [Crocosphaera sp.]|uniref:DUF2283 domain-containing protein n=1 Tax=Crocosphaera sp. TaxID=2729996 RepID=UPI002635D494|nr:DUF2283 domain-containing protein [Crocosphaera sp.]MDJ0581861.1 DUF2283 domain-containing protein [Crocosphaera sp.]
MNFQINYDQEVDAAYFRLENQTVLDSQEIADGIIIDYNEDNKIIGIELLGVKTINLENLSLLIPLLPESFKAQIKDFFSLEFNRIEESAH